LTLETSIEFLKGIGTERAKLIANVLDIRTVEDFLHFFPIRYLDKSKVYKAQK
jgi:ATP-dependent DNA helicase RecG